jgi:hypothetical protein
MKKNWKKSWQFNDRSGKTVWARPVSLCAHARAAAHQALP